MVGSACTRGGVGMPGVGTNMHPPSWADPLNIGGDIWGDCRGASYSWLAPRDIVWDGAAASPAVWDGPMPSSENTQSP